MKGKIIRITCSLIRLLVGFILIFGQTACSNSTQSALTTANEDNVTITFTSLAGSAAQYQSLMDQFEAKNPNIHVQFVSNQDPSIGVSELVTQGGHHPPGWRYLYLRQSVVPGFCSINDQQFIRLINPLVRITSRLPGRGSTKGPANLSGP